MLFSPFSSYFFPAVCLVTVIRRVLPCFLGANVNAKASGVRIDSY